MPSRINFFVRTMVLGRILTNDNLRKHRLVVDRCCLCKRAGESSNHFLLHCLIASELWSMMLCFLGFFVFCPRM